MNFTEYNEMIKITPFTETLKYSPAVFWLHSEVLPLGVVSIGEESPSIIKIPGWKTNHYGKTVPVISISQKAFANH